MGMSTYVIGFKPPDETWDRMKAVWDACDKAGILPPREVEDYFEGETPDPAGVKAKITVVPYEGDAEEGFEIMVDDIPDDVKIIRFVNSW